MKLLARAILVISLLPTGVVFAGWTTTNGDNVTGAEIVQEQIEEAEANGGRPTFYDSDEYNYQFVINDNTDICQVWANYLNAIPSINTTDFDNLMGGFGDAVELLFGSAVSEIGDGQAVHIDYSIGAPDLTELTCIDIDPLNLLDGDDWVSSAHVEIPITVDPALSSPKSGNIVVTGTLIKSEAFLHGAPYGNANACLVVNDVKVDVPQLDFWIKALIKGLVPSSYCVDWDDVWPF